ncbi:MAG: hypothetical protein WC516_08155 [Patescibacteria group bacterium]|jgi:hypothetical protein
MIQTDKPLKPFIEYVAEHIVKVLKGKGIDDICSYYVTNMVFRNPKTLEEMIRYYKLPKHDMYKMHKRLEEIIS